MILQASLDEDTRSINQIYLTQLTDFDLVGSAYKYRDQLILRTNTNEASV